MWATCALFFAYGFFARVAPSVMVEDLMRDYAVGAAIVGTLSALYFYAYAGLQLPAGIGLDRFGPRRVISIAAVICGAGSIVFGVSETLPPAYVGRLLIGGGAAFAYVGTLKLIVAWFPPRRFAMMFGTTSAFGVAAGALAQGPLASVIDLTGWRAIQVGGGILAFAIAAAVWMIVRDRPENQPSPPLPQGRTGVLSGLASVARNPQSWHPAVTNAAISGPLLCFGGLWGVSYMMTAYGLARPEAAFTASIMLIGHVIGAPLNGWCSDRLGLRKPVILTCVAGTLALFAALVYVPGLPLAVVYLLLFLVGVTTGCSSVHYATIKEQNDPDLTGTCVGFVNLITMGTSAVLQYLVGWILDLLWVEGAMVAGARVYTLEAYRWAMVPLIVAGAAGVVAAFAVRETCCRPAGAAPR